MKKWEYKVFTGYPPEDKLNILGERGWELIAVVTGGAEETGGLKERQTGWGAQDVYSYLKREKVSDEET